METDSSPATTSFHPSLHFVHKMPHGSRWAFLPSRPARTEGCWGQSYSRSPQCASTTGCGAEGHCRLCKQIPRCYPGRRFCLLGGQLVRSADEVIALEKAGERTVSGRPHHQLGRRHGETASIIGNIFLSFGSPQEAGRSRQLAVYWSQESLKRTTRPVWSLALSQ